MFTFVVVVLHFPGLSVLFMTVSHGTFAKSIRGAIWLMVVPQLANGFRWLFIAQTAYLWLAHAMLGPVGEKETTPILAKVGACTGSGPGTCLPRHTPAPRHNHRYSTTENSSVDHDMLFPLRTSFPTYGLVALWVPAQNLI